MSAFLGAHPAGALWASKSTPGRFVPANDTTRMLWLGVIETIEAAPRMANQFSITELNTSFISIRDINSISYY